jgi:hypothetical protein
MTDPKDPTTPPDDANPSAIPNSSRNIPASPDSSGQSVEDWALEVAAGLTAVFKVAYHEGQKAGLEMAAKEAERWWTLFNFDSFDPSDRRRAANPNQIAARIRSLIETPPAKKEKP